MGVSDELPSTESPSLAYAEACCLVLHERRRDGYGVVGPWLPIALKCCRLIPEKVGAEAAKPSNAEKMPSPVLKSPSDGVDEDEMSAGAWR